MRREARTLQATQILHGRSLVLMKNVKTMYIYWKRMALHPSLSALILQPVSCVSKGPFRTPSTALVTLNDPMFDECSRALSKKLSSHQIQAQISLLIRLLTP